MDCTLVTACFDLTKYHSHSRSIEDTLSSMDVLLKSPIYLVIHSDTTFMEAIKAKREENGFTNMTKYIEETYEDLWASQFTSKVKANREIYWPSRDMRTCAESHLITCNKYDFVLDAIEHNYFGTARFGWIDINMGAHIANSNNNTKICEEYTTNKVPLVLSKIKDDKFHIQILNVNDKKFLHQENKREFYQQYRWVVCGCFFVCGAAIGTKILNRLKEVVEHTTNSGFGHGEEPMYFDILDEFYDDIVRSYGDYGQILNNFEFPTKNLWYIYYNIANNYHEHGYNKECKECCGRMLHSFDNYLIEMDNCLYSRIRTLHDSCI